MATTATSNPVFRFFRSNARGFLIVFFLAAALSLVTNTFLTGVNLASLGKQVSIYAVLAIGELVVIITGGIDLGVGSVVGLTSIVVAQVVMSHTTAGGIWLGILISLLAGVLCGLITGALVAYLKLPPFIASLGMMQAARGVALLLCHGVSIGPVPGGFQNISGASTFSVPNLVWFTLIVVVIVAVALSKTTWGRYVYAAGSNAESARLSGVPVRAVLVSAYAVSGLLAAFAGILLASRLNGGYPNNGTGYELQAIAACVIGGASLFGARGTPVGALIGALIVGMLNNGGSLLGVDPFWLQVAIGVVIVAAVAVDQAPNWMPHIRGHSSKGGGGALDQPDAEPAVAAGEAVEVSTT